MENEILLQILSELKSLNIRQSGVEQKLDGVEQRLTGVEQKLDGVEQRLDGVEQRLDGVEQRLDGVERQQAGLAEELMAFQEFTMQKFERLEKRFDGLENGQKKTNLIIENEIRPSIQTLAEGQSQMQAQLNRIEDKVTSHDEIIFKRVK